MVNPLTLIGGLSWKVKALALVALVVGAFALGWTVKGWKEDATKLAINEAKQDFIDEFKNHENNVADLVQKRLGELKANERVVNNEILKIIDRPVYLNECLDAAGLHIIESARTGKASAIEPAGEVRTTK